MTASLLGDSPACRRAESAFFACIEENRMAPLLAGGVLLAFSGGPDSLLLFRLLFSYTKEKNVPFAACHVHHGIRGEEADRDAAFCRETAEKAGVPFFSVRVDVPQYAENEGKGNGIEAAARELRYGALSSLLKANPQYAVCATAHNATDNLETVLFHLFRGSGIDGLCGIPPVRLPFVRPLLLLKKEEVLAALAERNETYMQDSTNESTAYARNYIRKEILPRLTALHQDPEAAVSRLSANLREEREIAESEEARFFSACMENGVAKRAAVSALPRALAVRILCRLYHTAGGRGMPSRQTLLSFFSLLQSDAACASFDFPSSVVGELTKEGVRFYKKTATPPPYEMTLCEGENRLPNGKILYLLRKEEKLPINFNKLAIQVRPASVIMSGKIICRTLRPSDSYRYGNMTHRVRRLLSSLRLRQEERAQYPIVADENGIVWVPGFSPRDKRIPTVSQGTEWTLYYCQ